MNYTELKTAIADWAHRSDITDSTLDLFNTHALIDTPVLEWSGLLDSAQLVTQARE